MNRNANQKNLEEMLRSAGGAINLLRNSQIGPYVFPRVPAEYTNWRDEQRAWHNTVALLNLSYHQTDLYVRGPDALKLFSSIGINKFDKFPVDRAKQLVVCGHDGYMISDGILFHLEQDLYRCAGTPIFSNWVQYNAESGGFDVSLERDETCALRPGDPLIYMYQVQGPNALQLMQDVTDGGLPDIGFFHIGRLTIKGKPVRALRHGMAGQPGFELFGPWEDQEIISSALIEAGQTLGIRLVGALAYGTTAFESGWMPLQVPAIYHSEDMQAYREWLKPMNLEAMGSLGGSLISDDIRDYYMDPVEVGYGRFIDFEHDFIGREALRDKIDNPRRCKVTLLWNKDDIAGRMKASLFEGPGKGAKYINAPLSVYSLFQIDEVLKDGRRAGISQWAGFSANAQALMSLSLIDIDLAEPGTEVVIKWGESGSGRPMVEPHQLTEIRAKVAPCPYFEKTIRQD